MPSWYTHIAIGAGVGTAVWLTSMEPIALPVATVASLVPDIDTPGSYISYKVLPFAAHRGSWSHVKHRGAWHYHVSALAAALSVGIVTYHFLPMMHFVWAAAIATFVGWSSHIIADRIDTWFKKLND